MGIPKNPKPVHDYIQIDHAEKTNEPCKYDHLEINIGEADGVDKTEMSNFITSTARVPPKCICNIKMGKDATRVDVSKDHASEVVDELFGHLYSGRRVIVYDLSDSNGLE